MALLAQRGCCDDATRKTVPRKYTTRKSMRTTTHGGSRWTPGRALKQQLLNAMARLPDGVQRAMFAPPVRSVCIRVPVLRAVYSGCLRRHPIDLHYGTDTSGLVDPVTPQRDAHLALTRLGVRLLDDLQHLGTAEAVEAHDATHRFRC
jgi:hypothetical protein